jgi:hypothetical protein
LSNLDLKIELADGRKIDRPHREWVEQQLRWRWLIDSWEGGEVYRNRSYGLDARGFEVHNLIRHKREYPDPRQGSVSNGYILNKPAGVDQAYTAMEDDDYQLRLSRTPVPLFVSEVVDRHLSKVYSQEIDRETEDKRLADWWRDVDGRGNSVDSWMQEVVAPLFLVLGQLDLIFDHPPTDEQVKTVADERRLKLDRCVASYILPDNMLWWTVDRSGRYLECLVREIGDDNKCRYRYWDAAGWRLYDEDSKLLKEDTHPYKRVPIVRIFDRRRPRCDHVGFPRYEQVAELQREFYNRDSELILSDTLQAHPLIQGPEDYVQPDGTVPVGPGWLLPKKKSSGGTTTTYEGFDVVEFPKEGAKSIQENLDRIRERVDRAALLTKPAGGSGTSGNTVAQSGISKRMDDDLGNRLLTQLSSVLERVERTSIEFVSLVLGNGKLDQAAIDATFITYPRDFNLTSVTELIANITDFQALVSSAGALPETEEELICAAVRMLLPGRVDDDYEEFDKEIETYLASKTAQHQQTQEANMTILKSQADNAGQPEPDAFAS